MEFLEDMLASKTRARLERKLILVLDNVSFHHTEEVARTVERAEHELVFLPAYSPFLNPIEHTFATWKSHIQRPIRVAEGANFAARARQELLHVVEVASEAISPDMCLNWFRHCATYWQRCLLRETIEW